MVSGLKIERKRANISPICRTNTVSHPCQFLLQQGPSCCLERLLPSDELLSQPHGTGNGETRSQSPPERNAYMISAWSNPHETKGSECLGHLTVGREGGCICENFFLFFFSMTHSILYEADVMQ